MMSDSLNTLEKNTQSKARTTVKKKVFFLNLDELSNQNIVERWIATGLIQNWQPASNVAEKLKSYDPILGDFMAKVIEQNTKRKRWWTKNNAYMTGKDPKTGEYIKNANEYLKVMSDYIIGKANSGDWREWHDEWLEIVMWSKGDQEITKLEISNTLENKPMPRIVRV